MSTKQGVGGVSADNIYSYRVVRMSDWDVYVKIKVENVKKTQSFIQEYLPVDPILKINSFDQIICFGEEEIDMELWKRLRSSKRSRRLHSPVACGFFGRWWSLGRRG
jgi:hypothetical protein